MSYHKRLSQLLIGVMLVGQFGWVSAAAAESSEPQPAATPEANVSAEPSSSTSETGSNAEPSQSSTPSPSASVTPEPTTSPEPKSESTGAPRDKKEDISYSKPGVNGCVGIIPRWIYDVEKTEWVAADKGSFTCDVASGYYLSPKYVYDKQSGWYKIMPANVALGENQVAAPNVIHTVLGDLTIGSKDYQVAQALGLLNPTGGIVLANAGGANGASPVATNTVSGGNGSQSWVDLTNLVNVINTLTSNASSGSVAANSNTQAGNVSSGSASVLANIINLLASAWSWNNGSLNFFMQTIGELGQTLNGDVLLNPTQSATGGGGAIGASKVNINETGAGSTNTANLNGGTSLEVNAQNQGNIVNNIDVNANSGDANASKNTGVGNVSSGQATAEVNIINLINSFITSGSSFFGILNILGNLNGDILFPQGFLNGLVPSNDSPVIDAGIGSTGADSTNQIGVNGGSNLTSNTTDLNSISNNINTNAQSGTTSASSNTVAGDVSTGNASTTNSLFNLRNSTIFGDNAVLVIVNVLGRWVGTIMKVPNANGGTQSALLTGNAQLGVTNTGADSQNAIGINGGNNTAINQSNVGTITNNVNVNAQSGNTTATKNTQVGDVSTGDAKAVSSVANIYNTVLNVKRWFGVLVINVFGDWMGSVNDDTAAGNALTSVASQTGAVQAATATAMPKVGLLALASSGTGVGVSSQASKSSSDTMPGLALTAAAHQTPGTSAPIVAKTSNNDMTLLFAISAIIMLIAGALASAERKMNKPRA